MKLIKKTMKLTTRTSPESSILRPLLNYPNYPEIHTFTSSSTQPRNLKISHLTIFRRFSNGRKELHIKINFYALHKIFCDNSYQFAWYNITSQSMVQLGCWKTLLYAINMENVLFNVIIPRFSQNLGVR